MATTEAKRPRRPAGPKHISESIDPDGIEDRAAEEKPTKRKPREGKGRDTKKESSDQVVKYRVQFGGVSIGDETCRLGVQIGRDAIKIGKADELFCGRRIQCTVVAHRAEFDADQAAFDGFDDTEMITAVCDVKRYSVGTKNIGIGLTFALAEISIEHLANFAKRSGTLTIDGVRSLDEIESEDED